MLVYHRVDHDIPMNCQQIAASGWHPPESSPNRTNRFWDLRGLPSLLLVEHTTDHIPEKHRKAYIYGSRYSDLFPGILLGVDSKFFLPSKSSETASNRLWIKPVPGQIAASHENEMFGLPEEKCVLFPGFHWISRFGVCCSTVICSMLFYCGAMRVTQSHPPCMCSRSS